jgi:tetratricopeptide (TPR) repeat protein
MRWIASNNKGTYIETETGMEKIYPTNRIRIPVNKENALKYGIVAAKDADKMVDYIDITVDRQGLTKNRILMLDILANFNWERPLYFTGGANAAEEYIWLKDYLQLDGMSFKLVPIKTPIGEKSMFDMGRIDPEKMYANIKKLDWKNINDGKIYLDEQTKRNAISLRNNLMRLSEEFLTQKDTATAKEVLDLSLYKMPIEDFGHYSLALGYPEIYYKIGDEESARKTAETLINIFQQKLRHYSTYKDLDLVFDNIDTNLYMYRNILGQIEQYDVDVEYLQKLQNEFIDNVKLFKSLIPEEEPEAELFDNIKD